MSNEGTVELQQAMFTLLSGIVVTTHPTAVGVYDHVPEGKPKPYIVLGDAEIDPFDTKDSDGTIQALNIEVYSEYRGRREAQLIAKAIYSRLHHQNFGVVGFQMILCRFDHATHVTEPDGLTRRTTLRYIVLLSEEV